MIRRLVASAGFATTFATALIVATMSLRFPRPTFCNTALACAMQKAIYWLPCSEPTKYHAVSFIRDSLDDSGSSFCLHGLNAVWLADHGWYRVDPRGNRDDIKTDFDPPNEQFAFATRNPGERTYEQIFAAPLPVVVSALRRYESVPQLNDDLPDWVAQ